MSLKQINAKAAALRAAFEAAGAEVVDCDILLPAEIFLDLYGEDVRTRAYMSSDPARGEVMLRPDFTVPVVQKHMDEGAEPARYTYSGAVFRRQEEHPERASEYVQVGYEVFDREDPEAADAEVFALFQQVLAPHGLRAVTGDIGILTAAVQGLDTSERRRKALMRHIWRPRRFRALLDRFSGRAPVPPSRAALLASADPMADRGPQIGLRSEAEIAERIAVLRTDAEEPHLSKGQVELIEAILKVSETCSFALEHLRDIAVDLPAISGAVERFARRCEALAARGVAVEQLDFEASYGRSSMEYYDGFVFGFLSNQLGTPPVATGGRYDALTRHLGQGREIPAVGGVIRPGVLLDLEGRS
ncbi:ATP phosphoribosyltransferase regulatory subunit [Pelagimonas phthalicica]|uniref:ATP phosphoribosyltransferase regulatory subunit n=1 Tax=Pelagimonas phthalicica TaxID=1037362 RepID=A0A238JIM7_9RHOB|nr:ATP phosphoribosyltransferase regulatory subunit [Pelagimonas phthalicica]TDS89887.1 ATP phosphoribosyltransferase regulatory subunit [Pelagimonas phthalicica]SMX30054.1 ATP phosphoribosyltransferase regulatory subunit [Pelagimonas phthalicica]